MNDESWKLPPPTYWWGRFWFLRVLGLVYLVAFAGVVHEALPLLGSEGLLPADDWLRWAHERAGGRRAAFSMAPSVFHAGISDGLMLGLALVGLALSAALLGGASNGSLLLALWALYFSFVSVGQRWFQFGWESQLLETTLLAVFLVPLLGLRPNRGPPRVTVWLGWWLVIRIMLGAGLIKVRGDPCWLELTCLESHFETQPNPGPFSRFFHSLPTPLLHAGVLVNHAAELIVPWLLLGPRRVRHVAAVVLVGFQATLIVSGNLSFLNWLTLAPCLLLIDDEAWDRWMPAVARSRLRRERERERESGTAVLWARRVAVGAYVAVVLWGSVPVVVNLVSPTQAMNRSFGAWRIVNTYGAFGSVGEERFEIAIEVGGSEDGPWREIVFPSKPGPVDRRPAWITPYHRRLDWLAWFAGLEAARGRGLQREGWVAHLGWKLLHGDRGIVPLLAEDPYVNGVPTHVRVRLFRYRFADRGQGWWHRELVGDVFPPLTADDPRLVAYVRSEGWID